MATKLKKREKVRQPFRLPMGFEPREPNGLSPLAEFVASCEGEVSPEEAIREYQEEWCEHPRKCQRLVATIAEPDAERFQYTVQCDECGIHKIRKGRPPGWLTNTR